jgi:hypothetical protein
MVMRKASLSFGGSQKTHFSKKYIFLNVNNAINKMITENKSNLDRQ